MGLRSLGLALAIGGMLMACDGGEDSSDATGDGTPSPTVTSSPTFAPWPQDSMTAIAHTATPTSTPPGAAAPNASSQATPTTVPSTPTTAIGATVTATHSANPMIDGAIDDLAARLGVARTAIVVVSADEVEWSDGSLGCPQPGMLYTQALVPGVWIVLSAGGQQYAYHGRLVGAPFYCANPQ